MKIIKDVVMPDNLACYITENSFRPVRCLRLLYKYNKSYFKFIMRKLGISKSWVKLMCKYFEGGGTHEWRREIAMNDALRNIGVLLCIIVENDDYFVWLFGLKKESRDMLLSQEIFSWDDYEQWIERFKQSQYAPFIGSTEKALRDMMYNKGWR